MQKLKSQGILASMTQAQELLINSQSKLDSKLKQNQRKKNKVINMCYIKILKLGAQRVDMNELKKMSEMNASLNLKDVETAPILSLAKDLSNDLSNDLTLNVDIKAEKDNLTNPLIENSNLISNDSILNNESVKNKKLHELESNTKKKQLTDEEIAIKERLGIASELFQKFYRFKLIY